MLSFSSLLASAAMSLTLSAAPQLTLADTTNVGSGSTRVIVAHDACRRVANNNSTALVVPHLSMQEWAAGSESLLERRPSNIPVPGG